MIGRKLRTFLIFVLAAPAVLGATSLPGGEEEAFLRVTGPCGLEFPRDHGSHSGYRTEWWYYTGHLETASGLVFGFQLTFFRRQICPPGYEETWPEPHSAWRTWDVFLAHAALSDLAGRRFHQGEKMCRGAVGLAGVSREDGEVRIFAGDWSVSMGDSVHVLRAGTDDFSLDLVLTPRKDPVLHGDGGYSRKGSQRGQASCYYSLTRLEAGGTLRRRGGENLAVHGEAWMDHEFGSSSLEPGVVGWDWFSLQFADRTELMVYLLRQTDGSPSPRSAGTFVDRDGHAVHFGSDALRVEVVKTWKSPHSVVRYPAGWILRIDSLDLKLLVTPNLEDQEMRTPLSTRVTYWEGSVRGTGAMAGMPLEGRGYVELTGYERPLDVLR